MQVRSARYARQLLRTRHLYRRRVWCRYGSTFLIEHHPPLLEDVLRLYAPATHPIAGQSTALGRRWRLGLFLDAHTPGNSLRNPRAYVSEGNTVAVGVVPPAPPVSQEYGRPPSSARLLRQRTGPGQPPGACVD